MVQGMRAWELLNQTALFYFRFLFSHLAIKPLPPTLTHTMCHPSNLVMMRWLFQPETILSEEPNDLIIFQSLHISASNSLSTY
jgi:hypothetical protein